MNRREFLRMLGVGTTTFVTIGTGLWTPPVYASPDKVTFYARIGPDLDGLIEILEHAQPIASAFLDGFVKSGNIRHEWLIDDIR
jgi:hypothetical protein